jgi:hypothetical protein
VVLLDSVEHPVGFGDEVGHILRSEGNKSEEGTRDGSTGCVSLGAKFA